MPKYGNRKTRTSDGILHDSRKEALRWQQLLLLERAGEITDLKRQVEFLLIPDQRETSTEVYQKGEKKGMPKEGKLLERLIRSDNRLKLMESFRTEAGGLSPWVFAIKNTAD